MKRFPLIVLAASLFFVTPAAAQETPRMGGVLKVASIGEPPTLDIPVSTATLVYEIMWHVNESLLTYDKNFNPVPMLAESWTLADKGLKYTINLRKGVKFHNGKEMTSADVVPSLRRWGRVASVGRALWKYVESVDAKDPYTVVISMKQPSSSLLYGLSEPHAAIYPKESIEAAGEGQLKEFIGTGPFRFVEHRPDRHIKLARFKDYSARSEPPSGFGSREFYRLDPGVFFPEQPWHSTASAKLYNQKDKDKARRLLKEAGYAGQPVRWVTTREYEFMYKNALVAKQQLEEVGFTVDLQVVDWATLNNRTEKPDLWETFSTGFVFSADPANHVALRCTFNGWWCNEEKERLLAELQGDSDLKKRKAVIDRIPTVFYEDVGSVKISDYFTLDAARP